MNLRSKKFWFSITSFLLLVAGLFAALILVQRKQLIEKKAIEPTATLRFGVESFADLNPADPVDANIILDPGGQEIVAVDVVIDFDKAVLELVSIEPTAQDTTSFKTFLPIVSETDCTFVPDIVGANQAGRLEFGAATLDCDANGGQGAITPAVNVIVNPLAWLHFKVRNDALAGATGVINFYYAGEGETTDSNVVLNPTGDTVEDILLEPTSTVTVSVAGEPEPDKAGLNFQIKFQGIEHQGPGKTVRIILKQGDEEKYRFDSVGVTSGSTGVYSGAISNIDPGTYDIYLKGGAHLQEKFASVILNAGANTQDWTGSELLTADADGNNLVNIQDFRVLVETFDQQGDDLAADFNGNRQVDIQDFIFIKLNYDLEGD